MVKIRLGFFIQIVMITAFCLSAGVLIPSKAQAAVVTKTTVTVRVDKTSIIGHSFDTNLQNKLNVTVKKENKNYYVPYSSTSGNYLIFIKDIVRCASTTPATEDTGWTISVTNTPTAGFIYNKTKNNQAICGNPTFTTSGTSLAKSGGGACAACPAGTVTYPSLPSGVTLGEFKYGENSKAIVGSISEQQDQLIFNQLATGSTTFLSLPATYNQATASGTFYYIILSNPGTGTLYKGISTTAGISDDQIVWTTQIIVKVFSSATPALPPPPDTGTGTAPDTGTSTTEPTVLTTTLNGSAIESSGIDDTKCPADFITNKDGEKAYPRGVLKGVSCVSATKTLADVLQIVKNVVTSLLLPTVGVLFIIMLLLGGIVYITSAGNQSRADRGKKILTAAIIGLLMVVLSYTIITIFTSLIGGGIA